MARKSDWVSRSTWYRKAVAADNMRLIKSMRPADSTIMGAAMKGQLGPNDAEKAIEYATWLAARDGVELPAIVWEGFATRRVVNVSALGIVFRLSDGKRVVRAASVTFYPMAGGKRAADGVMITLPHLDYDPTLCPSGESAEAETQAELMAA